MDPMTLSNDAKVIEAWSRNTDPWRVHPETGKPASLILIGAGHG